MFEMADGAGEPVGDRPGLIGGMDMRVLAVPVRMGVLVFKFMLMPVFVLVHVFPPIKTPRAYDPRAVSY